MRVQYTPSPIGLLFAGGGSLLALLPVAASGMVGPMVLGVAGAAVLLAGVRRGSRRGVDIGAVGLYLNVLLAGTTEAGAIELVLGTVGAVVAWDSAANAVELRRQLPSATDTGGVELAHAAGTVGVIGAAAVTSSAVYLLVAVAVPVVVPLVLLLATLALVGALRR
jgi:hypothetical protein